MSCRVPLGQSSPPNDHPCIRMSGDIRMFAGIAGDAWTIRRAPHQPQSADLYPHRAPLTMDADDHIFALARRWSSSCCSPFAQAERQLHPARLDDGAEAEPRLAQRGAGDPAHADERHAVARRLADASVRPDEFRLTLRKEEQFGAWYDVRVPPPRTRISAHDGDAVGVVEELDQPRYMAVTPAIGWVHEH